MLDTPTRVSERGPRPQVGTTAMILWGECDTGPEGIGGVPAPARVVEKRAGGGRVGDAAV